MIRVNKHAIFDTVLMASLAEMLRVKINQGLALWGQRHNVMMPLLASAAGCGQSAPVWDSFLWPLWQRMLLFFCPHNPSRGLCIDLLDVCEGVSGPRLDKESATQWSWQHAFIATIATVENAWSSLHN